MADERRKNFRVQWNSSAMIYDCDGHWGHPCVLSDFSNGGAKISGVTANKVPNHFMLRMARGLKPRKCHVLWRTPDALGVEFVDHIASAEQPDARRTARPTRRVAPAQERHSAE
jgi:PilZ domain